MQVPILKHHKLLTGNGEAPPNSLDALEACLASGAGAIEFDIRAAGDDRFVLLHDATLERETNGIGPVSAIDSDAFAGLTLRGTRGKGDRGRTATLDDAVLRIAAHDRPLKVQIDLKEIRPLSPALVAALAAAVREMQANPALEVVVGCIADWNLRALRRVYPQARLGFDPMLYLDLPDALTDQPSRRVNAYGFFDEHWLGQRQWLSAADYLNERIQGLIEGFPHARECYLRAGVALAALDAGLDAVAAIKSVQPDMLIDLWTIDAVTPADQTALRRLLALGPDQITTNRAAILEPMIEGWRG